MSRLTTKQNRQRLRSYLVRGARWALILAVALSLGYGALLLGTTSVESEIFQLQGIQYQGVENLDIGPLNQMIEKTFPKNVLKIHLESLRSLVESENWVKSASVRRRLPNRIEIRVREREPMAVAAIDNELFVVDEDGVLLAPFSTRFDDLDLPIVRGLQNTALENAQSQNAARMKVYLRLINELNSAEGNYLESLSEVDVSDIERVAVVPADDPVPIILGDRRFLERYRVFLDQIDLYREVRDSSGGVKSVDVTFDDRIIIQTNQEKDSSGAES